jgi:hypothetical protein
MEVSGQFHGPAVLPPGKGAPGTHWLGGWVDTRGDLDDAELWLYVVKSEFYNHYLFSVIKYQSVPENYFGRPKYVV